MLIRHLADSGDVLIISQDKIISSIHFDLGNHIVLRPQIYINSMKRTQVSTNNFKITILHRSLFIFEEFEAGRATQVIRVSNLSISNLSNCVFNCDFEDKDYIYNL